MNLPLASCIDWLCERLIEEYPMLATLTVQKDVLLLKARILWAIPRGFVYWWTDKFGPYGGILIRPLNQELISRSAQDYWGRICDFDLGGDICWVDYAYGPGLYPKMIDLCRSTGCTRLGWCHRDRIHLAPMERMPRKTMRMAFHV